jgi:hypothetical protein
MMDISIIICTAGIGILLFLCLYIGFRTGLRLGMLAARGYMPPKLDLFYEVKRAAAEAKQDRKKADLFKGYHNMMAFDGEDKES